jgi:sugar fermentation stimulation protein A
MTESTPMLLQLPHDAVAEFRSRPNRFLGVAALRHADGSLTEEHVHIHDPGRLKELLYAGNRVLLRKAAVPHKRKTSWDLVAAAHEKRWVLVHSGYHRRIAERLLGDPKLSPLESLTSLRAEVKYGHSRIDFSAIQRNGVRVLIEVKGCTLAVDGRALFPDAPTERGRRHMATLMDACHEGLEAAIFILIFREDAHRFAPNRVTDPAFARAFKNAVKAGVGVFPLVLSYDGAAVRFCRQIPWELM